MRRLLYGDTHILGHCQNDPFHQCERVIVTTVQPTCEGKSMQNATMMMLKRIISLLNHSSIYIYIYIFH